MKEHLQKGALLVALGIVVIVGGFIITAAVLGLWLKFDRQPGALASVWMVPRKKKRCA